MFSSFIGSKQSSSSGCRWCSTGPTGWVIFNFGSSKSLTQFRIFNDYQPNQQPKNCIFQYSNSISGPWTTVSAYQCLLSTVFPDTCIGGCMHWEYFPSFNAVTAQFWRLQINSSWGSRFQISEVGFLENCSLLQSPIIGNITQPTCAVATGSIILNGLPTAGNWTITQTPGGNIYSGSGASATISGLSPGSYTFKVTNAAGCISGPSASVVIYPSATFLPPPNAINSGPLCEDGLLSLSANNLAPSGKSANFLTGLNSTTIDSYLPTVTNNFTIELWAYPTASRNSTPEQNTYIIGQSGQRYAIWPHHTGSTTDAGAGISIGTNGVSVYEHCSNYLPSILVYDTPIIGWTHIAVVYNNKTPSLYINGVLVRTGLTSLKTNIYPSLGTGGNYGFYEGQFDNIRVWDYARSQIEISNDMYFQTPSNTNGLAALYTYNNSNSNADGFGPNLTPYGVVWSDVNLINYSWTGPNGFNSNIQNPIVNTNASTLMSGTYNVVASINSCTSNIASTTVNVNALPIAPTINVINQPSCLTLTGSLILNDLPSNGNWIISQTSSGNIYTGMGQDTTISGLSPGTYAYTVTNADGCISNASASVIINPSIIANILQNDTTICEGNQITLSVASSGSASQGVCNKTDLPLNLQNGLVAYYPFCGNANDISGNANNGTVNGATLTSDRFGVANKAYSFNGTNAYIKMTGLPLSYSSYTISAWVKAAGDLNGGVVNQSGSQTSYNTYIHCIGIQVDNTLLGKHRINSPGSSGINYIYSSSAPGTSWHFCVITWNGSVFNFYQDGILINSLNLVSVTPMINELIVGTLRITSSTFNYFFEGSIDDIGVWNRALSQSEIQQLNTVITPMTYLWSNGATTQSINVTPSQSTTYYCTVSDGVGSCVDSVRVTVGSSLPPTGDSLQTFFNIATVSDLVVNGTGIKWYDAPVGGNLLSSADTLVHGHMYFASQSLGSCESQNRLGVSVSLILIKIVNLHFYLEGLYNKTTHQMNQAMDGNTALPHWGYDVADKISVELIPDIPPYNIPVVSLSGVDLLTNGLATFQIALSSNANYYIKVRNRNHIETWSALPVSFVPSTVEYDFRSSMGQAYGSDAQVLVEPNVYAFYLGDLDQNTWVDAYDFNIFEPDITQGSTGFFDTDLDGSGWVDSMDFNLFEPRILMGTTAQYPY